MDRFWKVVATTCLIFIVGDLPSAGAQGSDIVSPANMDPSGPGSGATLDEAAIVAILKEQLKAAAISPIEAVVLANPNNIEIAKLHLRKTCKSSSSPPKTCGMLPPRLKIALKELDATEEGNLNESLKFQTESTQMFSSRATWQGGVERTTGDLLQIVGQIVVDRATEASWGVLKQNLEDWLTCDNGSGSFKQSCSLLDKIRIQELIAAPQTLLDAFASDLLTFLSKQTSNQAFKGIIDKIQKDELLRIPLDTMLDAWKRGRPGAQLLTETLVSFKKKFAEASRNQKCPDKQLDAALWVVAKCAASSIEASGGLLSAENLLSCNIAEEVKDCKGVDVGVLAKKTQQVTMLLLNMKQSSSEADTRKIQVSLIELTFLIARTELKSTASPTSPDPKRETAPTASPTSPDPKRETAPTASSASTDPKRETAPTASSASTDLKRETAPTASSVSTVPEQPAWESSPTKAALDALELTLIGLVNEDWQKVTVGALGVLNSLNNKGPKKDPKYEKLFKVITGISQIASSYTGTSGSDAQKVRRDVIEGLMKSLVSRSERTRGVKFSLGGSFGLGGAYRAAWSQPGGGGAVGPFVLPIGVGMQTYHDCTGGFHLQLSVLDLGQYVSWDGKDLKVATPSIQDAVAVGFTAGGWFASKQIPVFAGAYGGFAPFVRSEDTSTPSFFVGGMIGAYVPFVDFN